MADIVQEATEPHVWDKARAKFREPGTNKHAMSENVLTAVKVTLDAWRTANSNIRAYWYALADAMADAVANPGKPYGVNDKIFYCVADGWLWARLPSGRNLAYAKPKLREITTPWGAKKRAVEVSNCDKGAFWSFVLWGGLASENLVQATARDVQAEAMMRLEAHGYPVVLHTHDEIAAERPYGQGALEEFKGLMAELPRWAHGLPVSVAGWEGERYRK
jgi:DNA polymerase